MADALEVGDLVMLKSGGPVMTVEDVGGDYASCVWFDINKPGTQPLRNTFDPRLLKKV